MTEKKYFFTGKNTINLSLIVRSLIPSLKAIGLIAAHPNIGRKTDVKDVRVKLVRDYLIFYEHDQEQVFILSIWDSRRNPEDAPY